MKGTFFQKPLELNLLVEGETWRQGDPITGSLTIKNHGSTEFALSELRMQVALEKTIQEFNMWHSMGRKPGAPWEYMLQQYTQVLSEQEMKQLVEYVRTFPKQGAGAADEGKTPATTNMPRS